MTDTDADVDVRLRIDEVVVLGRMPWSSNATFLVELRDGAADPERERRAASDDRSRPRSVPDLDDGLKAIYKPHRGERPLWDFPGGLYKREIAAYELAVALGWDCVPITVERDGPLGVGSLQRFVVADFEEHYFTLYEDESFHPQLMRLCAFDLVSNNTDRKGGHVLVDADRHLWGIDHGLSFHAEFKLRTVIWEFAGDELTPQQLAAVTMLCRGVPPEVAELISPLEVEAVQRRAAWLSDNGVLPGDESGGRYPWPLV